MPHAACVIDARGRVLWANGTWRRVLGVKASPAGALGFLEAAGAETGTPLAEALAHALAGEAIGPVVVQRPGDDGAQDWLEWRLSAQEDGHVVASARDLGRERRRSDAVGELRLLEGEAEQIAALGSWRLDLLSGTLAWSPEMYRIFGLDPSADRDLAEATATAVHPDDRTMVDEINKAVLGDGAPRPAQYRILLPDGTMRWVAEQGRQVCDESGRAVAVVGFVQ